MPTDPRSPSLSSTATTAARQDAVAEVVARFGDRVVDVAHLGPGGRGHKRAALLLGAGALAMVSGLGLFAYETAQPWESWSSAAQSASEQGMAAPAKPGLGTGALGLGLGLLGLAPFMLGGIRLREVAADSYAIGESPSARVTVTGQGLPSGDAFDLVRRQAEGVVLRFTPQMSGSVRLGDELCPLAQLPARDEGEHRAYTLAPGAAARVEHGGLEFFVRAVDPAQLKLTRAPMDRAYWSSVGGVATVAVALITLTGMMPADGLGFGFDDDADMARYARYLELPDEARDEPAQDQDDQAVSEQERGEAGQRHVGDEGKAGDPTDKSPRGKQSIKRRPGMPPSLARNFDPTQSAREAGVLGILAQQQGGFIASPYGGAFASGEGDENVWGNLNGDYVASAHGAGAMGLAGTGRSGGGSAKGLVGMGTTGLIGSRPGNGRGRLGSPGFGRKDRKTPPQINGRVKKIEGGLGRDIVHRIVRSHINEVRGCYNRALARNPQLSGRVEVAFVIATGGKVVSSIVAASTLRDRSTGLCIAKAVKRWKFPRLKTGGAVTVHYPFVLRPQ